MKAFEYAAAKSIDGALAASDKGYHYKGSGIDLLDRLKEGIEPANRFVSLLPIAELKSIYAGEDGITIGALSTLAEIASNELFTTKFIALVDAVSQAATPQIRERATAGGNLMQRPRCWYFRAAEYNCLKKGGDRCFAVEGENTFHAIMGGGPCHIVHPSNLATPLLAANAVINVRRKDAEPRAIPARSFFTLPDKGLGRENVLDPEDLLVSIKLASLPEKSAYVEFKEKQAFDWPMASCAVAFMAGKWSVVLGHVAPIPWLSREAAEVLEGATDITPELAEKAADAAVDNATPMSQNAFRVRIARAAVRRALLKAVGKEIV